MGALLVFVLCGGGSPGVYTLKGGCPNADKAHTEGCGGQKWAKKLRTYL